MYTRRRLHIVLVKDESDIHDLTSTVIDVVSVYRQRAHQGLLGNIDHNTQEQGDLDNDLRKGSHELHKERL